MPSHRGQSKKLAKQKARRADVKKRQARQDAARAPHALVRRAQEFPIDKTYLSGGWRSVDEEVPELVTALMVRRRGATILVAMALLDRTCLGIKSGFARQVSEAELSELVANTERMHGGLEQVDPLTWQSVVFHAVDFALSLGFEPDPDLPLSFLGPRPAVLLDTPLGTPQRPTYTAGPDDHPRAIVAKLMKARGTDFRAILGGDRDHPMVIDPARGQLLEPLYGADDAPDDEEDEFDDDDASGDEDEAGSTAP